MIFPKKIIRSPNDLKTAARGFKKSQAETALEFHSDNPGPGANKNGYIISSASFMNVRKAANARAKIIARLCGGSEVVLAGSAVNGYLPIKYKKRKSAFISQNYISLNKPEFKSIETKTLLYKNKSDKEVLKKLKKGAAVALIKAEKDFSRVNYNGVTGYVKTQNLILFSNKYPPLAILYKD